MNRDFVEMLSALSAAGVEFLIVGAHALAALRVFGAPLHDLTRDDLLRPDTVFQIGVVPCRIDILTTISGIEFDDAWPGRLPLALEDLSVACIGRDDLLANKRAAGRPQDLADVARLEQARR